MRFLVFSPDKLEKKNIENHNLSSSGQAVRSENRTLLARYGVRFEAGHLADYKRLIEWMLYGMIDFDFISESLFPELNEETSICDSKLKVGEMKYDVIVVPKCVTIRRTTLDRLKKFVKYGIYRWNSKTCGCIALRATDGIIK